jgi:microcystin-dependent protein
MGVVNTTYTFNSTDTITSAKLNNIIDDTTFTGDAISGSSLQIVSPGKLAVAAGGITANEIADGQVVLSKMQSTLQSSFVPSGAIMAFAMNLAPTGWLAANGDTIPNGSGTVQGKTADFSFLYALIGTTYGAAGKLPDLRGYFVRGHGTNSDSTSSGSFGAKQADDFKAHTHGFVNGRSYLIPSTTEGNGREYGQGAVDTQVTFNSGTGTETRPKNIAMLYCIKI